MWSQGPFLSMSPLARMEVSYGKRKLLSYFKVDSCQPLHLQTVPLGYMRKSHCLTKLHHLHIVWVLQRKHLVITDSASRYGGQGGTWLIRFFSDWNGEWRGRLYPSYTFPAPPVPRHWKWLPVSVGVRQRNSINEQGDRDRERGGYLFIYLCI